MNFTEERVERVLIVGVDLENINFDIDSSMAELEKLVIAAEGHVVGSVVQKRNRIDAAY